MSQREEDSKQADNEFISWRARSWLFFCPLTTNPHRNANANQGGRSDEMAPLLCGVEVLSAVIEAKWGPAFALNMFWVISMKSWGFTVLKQVRWRRGSLISGRYLHRGVKSSPRSENLVWWKMSLFAWKVQQKWGENHRNFFFKKG